MIILKSVLELQPGDVIYLCDYLHEVVSVEVWDKYPDTYVIVISEGGEVTPLTGWDADRVLRVVDIDLLSEETRSHIHRGPVSVNPFRARLDRLIDEQSTFLDRLATNDN